MCSFNTKSVINCADDYERAVLDIDLPDGNGVSLAEQLLSQRRVGCIAFFTATKDPDILARADQLGLVIQKSEGMHKLLEAIDGMEQNTRCRPERVVATGEISAPVG